MGEKGRVSVCAGGRTPEVACEREETHTKGEGAREVKGGTPEREEERLSCLQTRLRREEERRGKKKGGNKEEGKRKGETIRF